MAFTVTCNECGTSGTMEAVKLHDCDIALNGGRCEDFPACGHTDGDGCQTLESHTADYWMNLMRQDPDLYDEMDASGAWDHMD